MRRRLRFRPPIDLREDLLVACARKLGWSFLVRFGKPARSCIERLSYWKKDGSTNQMGFDRIHPKLLEPRAQRLSLLAKCKRLSAALGFERLARTSVMGPAQNGPQERQYDEPSAHTHALDLSAIFSLKLTYLVCLKY